MSQNNGDGTSLGTILIELQMVTVSQLSAAGRLPQAAKCVGEVLIRMKVIRRKQLKEAVLVQRVQRKVASDREIRLFQKAKKKRLIDHIESGLAKASSKTQGLLGI